MAAPGACDHGVVGYLSSCQRCVAEHVAHSIGAFAAGPQQQTLSQQQYERHNIRQARQDLAALAALPLRPGQIWTDEKTVYNAIIGGGQKTMPADYMYPVAITEDLECSSTANTATTAHAPLFGHLTAGKQPISGASYESPVSQPIKILPPDTRLKTKGRSGSGKAGS